MAAERWPARKLIRMKCDYVSVASCQTSVKEKFQRFRQFASVVKFCLNFLSLLFVIRVQFLHPLPALFLYGKLLSLVYFYLRYLLFSGFLQIKGNFVCGKNAIIELFISC